MSQRSTTRLQKTFQKGQLENQAVLDHLNALAVIQDDDVQKKLLGELIREYVILEKRVDGLLKNTLPEIVANDIKYEGKFAPRAYDCTILFSDIAGFTKLAERLSGEVLIGLLDELFRGIDDLVIQFRGTKIKTIGDAYMVVFGAPLEYEDHALMGVKTGLAMLALLESFNRRTGQNLQMRIGIHTGRVMAGVVGKERMQFDVFGDNVNIASRFESSGEKGRVNVSQETYMRTRGLIEYEERGEIALKNKANMKAYFAVKERRRVP